MSIICPLFGAGETEVLFGDHCSLRQDHRALDYVFEFAHVSRPIVLDERLHGRRGDSAGAELDV